MTMKVTEPKDGVGLSYAIEELITEARENDVDDVVITDELSAYEKAIREDRL